MSATLSLTHRLRQLLRRLITNSEAGVIAATLLITLVFFISQPAFLSESNVRSILTAVSYLGIIAVGQTILLVCGEFDLSVGSVAGLSAIVAADAVTRFQVPVPLGLLLGVAIGAALGLVNGLVVVRLRIPAFIQTLGMLFIANGLTQVITNGAPIYPLPKAITDLGQATVVAGLGWSFIFFVSLVVIGDVFLRRTVPGRNCYAVGGNEQVARLVGISVGRYKILAFVTTGALAACAGIFVMANLGSATTAIGSGWELLVIAGVVVGGVSLFGGIGTVVGGAIGILLLQIVQSGLVVVGVSPNWQTVAVGLIMVIAVGLDVARRRLVISEAASAPGTAASSLGAHVPRPDSSDPTLKGAHDEVGVTPPTKR